MVEPQSPEQAPRRASRLAGLAVLWALLAGLPGCGGGFELSLWWGDDWCDTAPLVVSSPPTTATVGQTYVHTLVFDSPTDCPLGACFDVLPLRLPAGAIYDSVTQRVSWTPAAVQAGTNVVFELATVTRDCGRQASWSWTVRVLP